MTWSPRARRVHHSVVSNALVGRLRVPLPPADAFVLFTAVGEREWVHGWEPRFPRPVDDDTEPGSVFVTDGHGGGTVWVVTARDRPWLISYARVTPGDRAGTVTVRLAPAGEEGEHSDVEVAYELTALVPEAEHDLRRFAEGYSAYLASWERDIAAYLSLPPVG